MFSFVPAVRSFLLLFLIAGVSCQTSRSGKDSDLTELQTVSADVVSFNILQMNDVYEIAPVESGQRGGLARVASIKNTLKAEDPNTISIIAGDFLSPSALGVTKINGETLAGKQMVDSLNAMGLDYAILGNHEFDISEQQLKSRIKEGKFKWVTANVFQASGKPFEHVETNDVIEFKNSSGKSVRVGLFGVCTDMAKKNWVTYKNALDVSREQVAALKGKSDVIVALTHLSIDEDKKIAAEVPELEVLLGGHEHENISTVAGADSTPIYKADANARTVYIHRFQYDTKKKVLTHKSELVEVDQNVPLDPKTDKVVKDWVEKVYNVLRAGGIEPDKAVGKTEEILDGYESSVRNRPTNLTALIAQSFADEVPEADGVIYGGGSIRIDARIPPGPITYFDVLKIFPFGGNLVLAEVSGATLKKALMIGVENKGSGGYLQMHNIEPKKDGWIIGGKPINDSKKYKILFNDFLMTGLERGLPFLNLKQPKPLVKKLKETREVRSIFITRLQKDMAAKK